MEENDIKKQRLTKLEQKKKQMKQQLKIHSKYTDKTPIKPTNELSKELSLGSPNLSSTVFKKQNNLFQSISMKEILQQKIGYTQNNDKFSLKSQFFSKYEIIDGIIGEGAHGTVRKCRLRNVEEENKSQQYRNYAENSSIAPSQNSLNAQETNSNSKIPNISNQQVREDQNDSQIESQTSIPQHLSQNIKLCQSNYLKDNDDNNSSKTLHDNQNNKQLSSSNQEIRTKTVSENLIQYGAGSGGGDVVGSIEIQGSGGNGIQSAVKNSIILNGSGSSNNNSHILQQFQYLQGSADSQRSIMQCVKEQTIYAVKIVRSDDEEIIIQTEKTFKLQKTVNSLPSVCKTYELYIDNTNKYLYQVMEFVDWPSLKSILKEKKQLPENEAKKVILALCQSVYQLHKRGICHRDLKPDNIMINPNDYSQIKIIDFGISRQFFQQKGKYNTQKTEMWTMTGTPQYKAPEMFQFGYTEFVDCWAIGVIAYEMLSGVLPFFANLQMDLIQLIEQCDLKFEICNNPTTKFSWNSSFGLAKDFIKRLLTIHEGKSRRLSAEDAMQHLWLENEIYSDIKDDIEVNNKYQQYEKDTNQEENLQEPILKWCSSGRQSTYLACTQTPTYPKRKNKQIRSLKSLKMSPKKKNSNLDNFQNQSDIEEEEEQSEDNMSQSIMHTKSLLQEYYADNQDTDVHRSQSNIHISQSNIGGIQLNKIALDRKIRDRKNSVRLYRTPKSSESELNTPQSIFGKVAEEFQHQNSQVIQSEEDKNVQSSNEEESIRRQKKNQIIKKSGFSTQSSPKLYLDSNNFDNYTVESCEGDNQKAVNFVDQQQYNEEDEDINCKNIYTRKKSKTTGNILSQKNNEDSEDEDFYTNNVNSDNNKNKNQTKMSMSMSHQIKGNSQNVLNNSDDNSTNNNNSPINEVFDTTLEK